MPTTNRTDRSEYMRGYQAKYAQQLRSDAKVGRALREAVAASDRDALMAVVAAMLAKSDA
nr:hypothetical protein [Rhodococcus wratislaviensis]GLK38670.1 hypothetical protein GCM10017611_55370 [Rhodococcus wratislaviensis]